MLSTALAALLAAASTQAVPWPAVGLENDLFRRDVPNDTVIIPAPMANGGAWSDSYARAKTLVDQMTVEEKVGIVTGQPGRCVGNTAAVERLGIPALCLEDGPAGIRPIKGGASQFPAGLTAACTWDRQLFYERSKAMGQEFYDLGVQIALAPVTGGPLGRSPLNGRNWEGSFADPYGTGEYSYMSVKGMQDSGVAACSKHWIGYEQETDRRPLFGEFMGYPIDSHIDDQTTHELYEWGFAEAVRAGTSHVMCSYNEINGTHACSDSITQNGLLKGELNFQGSIISDWGGHWDSVPSALGGLDMSQPGRGYGPTGPQANFWGPTLVDLVNNGTVPESRLSDQVLRILTPYFHLGQADKPLPSVPFNAGSLTNLTASYRQVQQTSTLALIKKIGEEGAVLLKNKGGLPLKHLTTLAVLGEDAGPNLAGAIACGDGGSSCPEGNINGTMSLGFGSGYAYPNNLVTPLSAISDYAVGNGNFAVFSSLNNTDLDSISATAAAAETALVFVNAFAGEGQDRYNLSLSGNGDAIVQAAASQNNKTIVVLHIPGPTLLEAWIDHPNVTAVIAPMLPGEQSGYSLTSLLFGSISPSGKLVFTIAKSESDYPPNTIVNTPDDAPTAVFSEGLNIDYRWFDAHSIEPRYPFGFGLSYSTFGYSDLQVKQQYKADDKAIQKTAEPFYEYDGSNSLYDEVAQVTVEVKNTGSVTACETAQLYISFGDAAAEQPPWQLRGFDKIQQLGAGKSATATFTLRRKDVSTWRVVEQRWQMADAVTIGVGPHSRSLNLKKSLQL